MIGFEISNVRSLVSGWGGINFRLIFDNPENRTPGSLPSGEGEAACCEVELHCERAFIDQPGPDPISASPARMHGIGCGDGFGQRAGADNEQMPK